MAGTRAEFEGYMGTWVTSRGRRVFIRDGEGIAESILRYNKSHGIKTTRHDIQASIYEYDKMNKQQKFIDSVPKEIDEKEYNQNAKEFRDAYNLEDEYNRVYENPNYYEDMQGTSRLKENAMKQPISDYVGKHEDKSQHMIDSIDENGKVNYTQDVEEYYASFPLEDVVSDLNDRKHQMETGWYAPEHKESYQQWNEATQKYIEKRKAEDYESGNYNPMEEFSDTIGDGLTDLQRRYGMTQDYINRSIEANKTPGQQMYDSINIGKEKLKSRLAEGTDITLPFTKTEEEKLKEKLIDDNEIGFVQTDSMYGGVIKEYTNKELREMAERGIRPRKDSYGHPGAWEGINSDKGLSNKEIAKAVQDAMKKKYPNTKLTRSTAGYDSVEITIASSSEPIVVSNNDIDKMGYSDFGRLSSSNGFDWWAKENVPGYKERAEYSIEDVRKYAKTLLKEQFKGTSVSQDAWYLTEYGKNLVKDIQRELNSYNYDDSNGMVDYFNSGFYDDITLGKWNKPFESVDKKIEAKVERFKNRKKR